MWANYTMPNLSDTVRKQSIFRAEAKLALLGFLHTVISLLPIALFLAVTTGSRKPFDDHTLGLGLLSALVSVAIAVALDPLFKRMGREAQKTILSTPSRSGFTMVLYSLSRRASGLAAGYFPLDEIDYLARCLETGVVKLADLTVLEKRHVQFLSRVWTAKKTCPGRIRELMTELSGQRAEKLS